MLFLTYWELNENMPEGTRLEFAQKLTLIRQKIRLHEPGHVRFSYRTAGSRHC